MLLGELPGNTRVTGTGPIICAEAPSLKNPGIGAATGDSLQLNNLTPSQAVYTDGVNNLMSVPTIGSGQAVRSINPTLVSPLIEKSLTLSNCGITFPAIQSPRLAKDTGYLYEDADNNHLYFMNENKSKWDLCVSNEDAITIFPTSTFSTNSKTYVDLLDGFKGKPITVSLTKRSSKSAIFVYISLCESHTLSAESITVGVNDGTIDRDVIRFPTMVGPYSGFSGMCKIASLLAGNYLFKLRVKIIGGNLNFTPSCSASMHVREQ